MSKGFLFSVSKHPIYQLSNVFLYGKFELLDFS